MKKTVCIDGQHGTTGLTIHQRLRNRADIELVEIPEAYRKDAAYKAKILNEVDVVFLCLPDAAARESLALIRNEKVKVIDPSSAHRTADHWVYGIPELNPEQRSRITASNRVTVPGCHATGFVVCLHPLVSYGIVPAHYPVACYSISGYSGGGKRMIGEFENERNDPEEICCRPKNLNLGHKHLPEMKKYGLLENTPILTSIVGNYFNGMLVMIPLPGLARARDVHDFLSEYYTAERFIRVATQEEVKEISGGMLSPTGCNGTNLLEIFVFDRNESVQLVARLDNLGKGSGGAAVQNMNLMTGAPEECGLLEKLDVKGRHGVKAPVKENR